MVFLQGNPFDHCGDTINIINNYDFSSHFVPLGDIVNLSTSHTSINDQIIKYSTEIGFKVTFPVNMVPGGQYIISKDLILKNDIEFYKKILNSLSIGLYPQSGLDLEKTLFQIYGIYDV